MSMRIGPLAFALALAGAAGAAQAAGVNQVSPGTLITTNSVTFDDVAAISPGTNYNGLMISGGLSFGERFNGQTTGASGVFDTLSGSPLAGLTLLAGAANQNLVVVSFGGSQVLAGLNQAGYPNVGAIGPGAVAFTFPQSQSGFGISIVGANAGSATFSFYDVGGGLIDAVTLSSLTDAAYAFQRQDNVADIAGVTIVNNDPGGIGYDNLRYSLVTRVQATPEPASLAVLGMGLLGFAGLRRRR